MVSGNAHDRGVAKAVHRVDDADVGQALDVGGVEVMARGDGLEDLGGNVHMIGQVERQRYVSQSGGSWGAPDATQLLHITSFLLLSNLAVFPSV